MRVSAPADKRFRRARVMPSKRARWYAISWPKAARAIVILAVILFGTYRAAALVLSAPALTITRFEVSGNSRMSVGQIASILDGLRGSSMVTADLERWRRELLRSPWVADAAMRRVLPGTIAVAISERQPMGIGRVGESLYLVDNRGEVIDQFGPNYAEIDLPLINGLAGEPRDDGSLVDQARAHFAVRVLAELEAHPRLATLVSEIDVTDSRDAVLLLKGDTVFVRIGDDHFAERVQSYLDIAPALHERIPEIDYVDLRFDERVYAQPQRSDGAQSRRRRVRQED